MKQSKQVVFLFNSKGAASPNTIDDNWEPKTNCFDGYVEHHKKEGYMVLLEELLNQGVIDDLKVFYESNVGSGFAEFIPNTFGCVIPEIRFSDKYISEDAVIFARGGFRTWFDWLLAKKNKHWLMLYAANTGREKWDFWDIILHDLERVNHIDNAGRYWHYFHKPVDESTFYPEDIEKKYDLCIGASHIHDRKGQWRTILALIEYKKMFGKNIKAILPGSIRRGVNTNGILENISAYKLDVECPGMVGRNEMRRIYNSSKYFIHSGEHGQNDRGPLEALACGTPLIIASPHRHSPEVSEHSLIIRNDNFKEMAVFFNMLVSSNRSSIMSKDKTIDYYQKTCSLKNVVVPRMKELFTMLFNHKPSMEAKVEIQKYFKIGEI